MMGKLAQLGLALTFLGLTACAAALPDVFGGKEDSSTSAPASVPSPRPSISEIHWSYAGPIAGEYCTQWTEAADPDGWTDNYLCTTRDFTITWNSAVADPNLHCILINEEADPHTWTDNYLCSLYDLGIVWSNSGPIAGKQCLAITEPSEPVAHTWNDNYLCVD